MSMLNGTGNSIPAYGAEAFIGFSSTLALCVLMKKITDYLFPSCKEGSASKFLITSASTLLSSFLTSRALSILTISEAKKITTHALASTIGSDQLLISLGVSLPFSVYFRCAGCCLGSLVHSLIWN